MFKLSSLALLAGGILLLMLGVNSYDSFSFQNSRQFIGSMSDSSSWLLVCGAAGVVLGGAGLFHRSRDRAGHVRGTLRHY